MEGDVSSNSSKVFLARGPYELHKDGRQCLQIFMKGILFYIFDAIPVEIVAN